MLLHQMDEKVGLRGDAVRSQVIDALEAQEMKETGNGEGWHCSGKGGEGFLAFSRQYESSVADLTWTFGQSCRPCGEPLHE